MRTIGKSYWMGVSTDGDKAKTAVKSWFLPLCADMTVESAEILCDVATDREKKIRAVMVDAKGKRFIAERSRGARQSTISLKAA